MKHDQNYEYDIALSFAGEDRNYVEETAKFLQKFGYKVFYDKYEIANLWGKNLYTHLQDIYFKKAKYTVMFISQHYRDKLWTNHERESAQARALSEKVEYILPARFDDTAVPGLLPTINYIDLGSYTPEKFADVIKEKVGKVHRQEFFPKESLDRFYHFMDVKKEDEQLYIYQTSHYIFQLLLETTPDERFVLLQSALHTEHDSLPDSIIIKLSHLGRLTSLSKDKIIKIFEKLYGLYVVGGIIEKQTKYNRKEEYIEIITGLPTDDYEDNITGIFVGIIDFLSSHLCPHCVEKAFEIIDFSELSSITGFSKEIY